jgi:hypothetical protein
MGRIIDTIDSNINNTKQIIILDKPYYEHSKILYIVPDFDTTTIQKKIKKQ